MQKPIVIDFETPYDKDVTLTKMSYSEYVPRAQPYLVGILLDGQLYTVAGYDALKAHLEALPWHKLTLIAHNAMFDALVLAHWIDRKPSRIACTLSASRALYPSSPHDLKSLAARLRPDLALKDSSALIATKGRRWDDLTPNEQAAVTAYCKHDVLLCASLYEHLYPQLPQIEKDLIDQIHQNWITPRLEFDTNMAQQAVAEELIEERKLLNAVGLTHGEVRSNAIFTKHLAGMGYTLPTKWSQKQQKEVPALAKSDTELNAFVDEHPELADLIALKRRVNSSIKQSRTERLINIVKATNGKLPVGYLYHGALTGRMCLTEDTRIQILRNNEVLDILLPDLLPDDKVWDGTDFVSHGGLVYQGNHEVITYDGITGTPDHRVFVDEIPDAIELRTARERGYTLKTARPAPKLQPAPAYP